MKCHIKLLFLLSKSNVNDAVGAWARHEEVGEFVHVFSLTLNVRLDRAPDTGYMWVQNVDLVSANVAITNFNGHFVILQYSH